MIPVAISIYFLATLYIGFWASKKVKSAGDFINAGRNLHPAVNTAALFALWFGSETILGASSEFYQTGFKGIIEDPLGGVLCLLLVGLFFARKLYRLNILTIGDLFRNHYGPKIELLSSVLMVVSFVGYAAAQIVAIGLLIKSVMGMDFIVSMTLGTIVVMLYTFTGGMWAVSVTDFIQSISIVLGLIIMAFVITPQVGGVAPVLDSITQEQKEFFPENTTTDRLNWLAAWMVLGLGSIASQDIFQRVNAARSEKAASYSTLAGGLLYFILSFFPLYLIQAGNLLDPTISENDSQMSLLNLVSHHMPAAIQIVFLGALLSAIMSTCSGALLAPASILSENIIKPLASPDISDKNFLLLTRVSVIFISMVSYFVAVSHSHILSLVAEASVIGLVTVFVPFVAALHFNNRNVISAMLSMVLGSVVYILFRIFPLSDVHPSLWGLLGSLSGFYLGKVLTFMAARKRLT
jgi:SSS family transporter